MKGARYIGVGLVDGHYRVLVIEPDGSSREHYRSTQPGEVGRPFAFSYAIQLMEEDAARQL